MSIRRRIVFAEDNPLVQMTMVSLLELMGHDVLLAATGREALDALAAGPDLLIADLNLPDMNGSDLAAEALARNSSIGVVIASGDPPDDESPYIWLTKPFTVGALRAAIARASPQTLSAEEPPAASACARRDCQSATKSIG